MCDISVYKIGQVVGSYVANKVSRIEQAEYLAYGAEILIGSILKLGILFFIAVMMKVVLEVTVLLMVTGIVRTLSGGAHCSAYYRCLVTSVLILTMLGYTIKITYPFFSISPISVLIGIAVLSVYLYWRYAPQAPLNKPFNSKTKKLIFRWYSLFAVVGFTITSIILGTNSLIAWTIIFALLWQAFTLTPVGHSFIRVLDILLTPNKKGGEAEC
ncbi:accessory gene regulator ArgB-like protein [Cellulosilyticum sp. I15G10I2]|uniref:accessory gene regulator ArgB-like protein n=1 Tax=Cellulosilyticum sp. I15G10I2 TaxID=1892843 RepID=UPI00085CDB66|nr:accessory gene regulator B family protein [Cellulosilyticum sp. I15G10I2]